MEHGGSFGVQPVCLAPALRASLFGGSRESNHSVVSLPLHGIPLALTEFFIGVDVQGIHIRCVEDFSARLDLLIACKYNNMMKHASMAQIGLFSAATVPDLQCFII